MFTSNALNLIKKILIIIFVIIILDLFINILIPEKIKKEIGITKNYSLKSERFHHKIAPNINVYEYWGDNKYKVKTNVYSMRILNERSSKIEENKNNIGFMGDSFVYGSGINYDDHFINKLSNKFKNFNMLNLGFVSYSPSIYFKRIQYYVDEKKIKFKKIFLFVDVSDIQDEGVFYRENYKGNIVRKWLNDNDNEKKLKKYKIKNYLQQNSFIFKFYQVFFQRKGTDKSINCLNKKEDIDNYIPYIDYERMAYGIDKIIQKEEWVVKGMSNVNKYLDKIKNLSKKEKFELIIVYYPSAVEVIKKINFNKSLHFELLKKWSDSNNVDFIDASKGFGSLNTGLLNYKKNFILCDVHWNRNGHEIIANYINKYLNEKN